MEQIIREQFQLRDRDVRETSSLSLAFLGDSVYELVVRTVLVERGGRPAWLDREKKRLVNAGAQARTAQYLQEAGLLTEEELAVFRRGRNANPHTVAKHATVQDYHKATGLEALMGYLYLKGQTERLTELVRLGLEELEREERKGHRG